jgi:hypothetical protein
MSRNTAPAWSELWLQRLPWRIYAGIVRESSQDIQVQTVPSSSAASYIHRSDVPDRDFLGCRWRNFRLEFKATIRPRLGVARKRLGARGPRRRLER